MGSSIIYAEGNICQCVAPKNAIMSNPLKKSQIVIEANGLDKQVKHKPWKGKKVHLAYDVSNNDLFVAFKDKEDTVFAEIFELTSVELGENESEKEVRERLNKLAKTILISLVIYDRNEDFEMQIQGLGLDTEVAVTKSLLDEWFLI